jgi:hypothetical protein
LKKFFDTVVKGFFLKTSALPSSILLALLFYVGSVPAVGTLSALHGRKVFP